MTVPGGGSDPLARAVLYDGEFDLAWLADDERVSSAGDDSGACIISSPRGERRISIGQAFVPTVAPAHDPVARAVRVLEGKQSGRYTKRQLAHDVIALSEELAGLRERLAETATDVERWREYARIEDANATRLFKEARALRVERDTAVDALHRITDEIDVRLEIPLPPSMEDLRMWKRIALETLAAIGGPAAV